MTESNFLGPDLEPPRGGLERLRHALQGKRKARRARPVYWIPAGLAAGLAAVFAIVWTQMPRGEQQIHRAVVQAFEARQETHFKNAAYIEIPSHRDDVRILLLGSLPQPRQPDSQPRG